MYCHLLSVDWLQCLLKFLSRSKIVPAVSSAGDILSTTERLSDTFSPALWTFLCLFDVFAPLDQNTPRRQECTALVNSYSILCGFDTPQALCVCSTCSIFMAGTCILPVAHGSWDDTHIETLNFTSSVVLTMKMNSWWTPISVIILFPGSNLKVIVLKPWDITSN